MESKLIRSPYLAYVPFIGCCFEESAKDVIKEIGKKNLSLESVKSGYQFIASHIHSGGVKKGLKSKIEKAKSKEEIKNFIDPLIDCIIDEGVQHLRHLDLFDFEQFKTELLQKKEDFFKDALERAKRLPAEFVIDKSSVKLTTLSFTSFVTNLLHLFQSAFRLDPDGRYMSIFDTNSLLEIYWKYLTIPVFMASKLADWLLDWSKALIIVIIFHVIIGVALYVYNKFFKMAPATLPRGINLNIALKEGRIDPVSPHKPLLKGLNNMIESDLSPVLIGEAGSGKSSLAVAFAQQQVDLEKKKMSFYQVYTIDTTALVGSYDGMADQLNYMDRILGSYKGQAVIFLEEFDTAMQKVGQNLWKTLFSLRTRHKEVMFVPAMTTENFLEVALNEKEFNWRFDPLLVEGTFKKVIRDYYVSHRGNLHVTEMAIEELIKGEDQPVRGIKILKQACQIISSKKLMGSKAEELERQESELAEAQSLYNSDTTNYEGLTSKERHIKELNELFKDDLERWEKVQRLAQRFFQVTKLGKTLARDLESGRIQHQKDRDRTVKAFAFIQYHLLGKLKKRLADLLKENEVVEKQEHFVPACVDVSVVKEVQRIMLEKDKKLEEIKKQKEEEKKKLVEQEKK